MSKDKNHAPYTVSDTERWMNCPGSKKKLPRFVLYGKGGIGKTSFVTSTSNPIIIQSTEEKKK
jgi:hypothetical protein